MNWQDIINITLLGEDGTFIRVDIGIIFIICTIICLILIIKAKKGWRNIIGGWKVEEANIKLGGMGDVKIKPDYEDIQIAHKAWTELSTRKAGLEFDEEHDVITQVYNSWYKLFGEMRELVKQIPSDKIRNSDDTRKLVILLIDALNKGLRPHLTKWQARFRAWFDHEQSKYPGRPPQEVQRKYPMYGELVKELKTVNKQMIEYTNFIKMIAHGDKET